MSQRQTIPATLEVANDATSLADGGSAPSHIAIIMDGNGRWAKARGFPRSVGHNNGAEAVRRTVKAAVANGIPYLTLFGFSSENWKRPKEEINDLMGLLRFYLRREIDELDRNGVRLQVIGERAKLSNDIVRLIEESEARTAGNGKLHLTIALSYGGRAELVDAAQRAMRAALSGELAPEQMTEEHFGSFLSTAGMPDPDLLIRTSGEKRISNFLLWQCAYAEFIFIEKHWPDFDGEDLKAAIDEFRGRTRRYGATS